jgi:hypothetical protein
VSKGKPIGRQHLDPRTVGQDSIGALHLLAVDFVPYEYVA